MRNTVPFPAGPGDWRYDPTTGRLIDASKTPPEEITAADADEFVDMTPHVGGPGIPVPPIKIIKRRKR